MKPARLVWSLCLLFFALMALATILAVDRSYRELPRVALDRKSTRLNSSHMA